MHPVADGLLVREATSADAPALLALVHAAFEEYRGRLEPPSGAHAETAASIRRKLDAGGAMVAVEGDVFVGCAFYQQELEHLYLGRLAVAPERRGRGIARRLVECIEARARGLGLARVRVGVRLALTQNRAYFERAGYAVTKLESHPGFMTATSATMEKTIAT